MRNSLLITSGALLSACHPSPAPPVAQPVASPTTAVAPAADPSLIVPGESIGAVYLGDRAADVRRQLGQPSATLTLDQTTALIWLGPSLQDDGWHAIQPGFAPLRETFTVLVQDDRVVQIEASGARFHTAGGISTATSVEALRSTLVGYATEHWKIIATDDSASTPASKHFVFYDDLPTGIAVKYGAWGNLSPEPDLAERPEAIVIHAPGHHNVVNPQDGLPYAGRSARSFDFPTPTSDHVHVM